MEERKEERGTKGRKKERRKEGSKREERKEARGKKGRKQEGKMIGRFFQKYRGYGKMDGRWKSIPNS
jgi:hypothetical protein